MLELLRGCPPTISRNATMKECSCRMCMALLRECEGLFKRHADGTDTGDCSTIHFTDMSFLCYRGSVWRNKIMREIHRKNVVSDPWNGQGVVLCGLLIHPLSTVSSVFSKSEVEGERIDEARAVKLTFHMLPPRRPSST